MDIQEILNQLKEKFGDSLDMGKITNALKSIDLKNLSFPDIVSKLHADGLLGDVKNLNLDSLKGNVLEGLKNKAGGMLGGIFGK